MDSSEKMEVLEQAVEQLRAQLAQRDEYVLKLEARLGGLFQQQEAQQQTSQSV